LQAAVASVKRRAAAGEAVTPADVDAAAATLEASWPAGPPSEEARLRRARQWQCLVASDVEGHIIGCAVLAWCVPDATLPAPWPSSKPQRLYLSNMAVAPSWRRRGLATALLAAAERLARAWGENSIWLHVDEVNSSGRKLYEASGFTLQDEDPFWVLPPKRKLLLAKDIGRGSAVQPSGGNALT
jgi:GNAT superfamily N-acetyltransferase